MAQHDYSIANQTAPSLRTDLNNALSAIVSQNSGTTAPSTTYANMLWYDTTNDILKMRNEANTGWIELLTLDQGSNLASPSNIASQAEAEAGTNNTKMMTPLRTVQAVANALPGTIYTDLTALSVSASDLYTLSTGLPLVTGTISTTSAAFVTAATYTVDKFTGSIRFKASHKISSEFFTSELRVLLNGTVQQTWSTNSLTPVERSRDITVVPTDTVVWQHRSPNTSQASTVSSITATASNRWIEEPLYVSEV